MKNAQKLAIGPGGGSNGRKKTKKKKKKKTVVRVIAPLERVKTMDEIATKAPEMLFAFENDVLHEREEFAKATTTAATPPKASQPYHKQGDHYFDTHHMRIQRGRQVVVVGNCRCRRKAACMPHPPHQQHSPLCFCSLTALLTPRWTVCVCVCMCGHACVRARVCMRW